MASSAEQPGIRTSARRINIFFLPSSRPFDVLSVDHGVVEIYRRVRTVVENSGTAIGALDTFIATQALSLGATLVTSNAKEFARVPGLQIERLEMIASYLRLP